MCLAGALAQGISTSFDARARKDRDADKIPRVFGLLFKTCGALVRRALLASIIALKSSRL